MLTRFIIMLTDAFVLLVVTGYQTQTADAAYISHARGQHENSEIYQEMIGCNDQSG